MRTPLFDGRLDVGGVSTSTPRRRERKLTRDLLRILDGFMRFGIIPIAGRIVYPKHLERRLVHKDVASLRDHAGDRAHCITHGGMLGHDKLRAEAAGNFRVKRGGRSAYCNQWDCETDLSLDEAGERAPCRDVIYQDAQRSPTPIH